MGYEVLDVGTSGVPSARSGPEEPEPRPAADPEVVDLDDLPEPQEDDEPPEQSRLLGRNALRTRTALVLLTVLAVGVVAGATWTGSVNRRERTAERQATLAVTALADSWTRVPWIRRPVVDVVVRLVNTGPLPVEVVASGLGERPRTRGPFVRALGGGLKVGPGEELSVSLLQRLDCSSSVPLSLEVPLQTADGVVHDVAVRRGGAGRLVPRLVCQQSGDDLGVTATLTGTLRKPVVELRNPLPRPVTILFDPMSPPARAQQVSIRTDPELPTAVGSGETRRLALDLRAPSCPPDSAAVQDVGGLNLVALSEIPGAGEGSPLDTQRQPLQVDLSALVGAAVQRACG